MNLTEFLLARIAEDEAGVSHIDGVNWTAARVLAECEAKRHVVAEVEATRKACRAIPGGSARLSVTYGLDRMLRFLAVPYADHPDFDEAWHG